jgi:hypothetical protein
VTETFAAAADHPVGIFERLMSHEATLVVGPEIRIGS